MRMQQVAEFVTIGAEGRSTVREKGSSFLGFAHYVENKDQIAGLIQAAKKTHPSARHWCYAWKTGVTDPRERSNDDGEPSGTAGRPIMDRIRSNNITNVLVIVVRYFGGTLLGTPGLIRCYGRAAEEAIAHAGIVTRDICRDYELSFTSAVSGDVMKCLRRYGADIASAVYGESCTISFSSCGQRAFVLRDALSAIHTVEIHETSHEKTL